MAHPDPLAPQSSPSGSSALFGGRRPNKTPAYIIGAVMTSFIVVVAMAAANRTSTAESTNTEENELLSKQSDTPKAINNFDKGATGLVPRGLSEEVSISSSSGIIVASADTPPLPPADDVAAQRMDELQKTLAAADESKYKNKEPETEVSDFDKSRLAALQDALRAPTSVQGAAARSQGSSQSQDSALGSLSASSRKPMSIEEIDQRN